jgi:hypothetical protein
MRIWVCFRDRAQGFAEANGEETASYGGPKPDFVRHVVEFYSKGGALRGVALLRRVLNRVHGNTWASESETAPAVLADSEEQPADH